MMSALCGLTRPSLLQREIYYIIRPNCIRRFHFAINQSAISADALPVTQFNPSVRFTIPSITSIIPIITGIWGSILRAVPKKKTSHSKKRKRQLVGKGLKDKTNLTRCEACGDWKLLHTLCPSCVKSIQRDWRKRERLEQ
jgi:large subunit ribosomal protein L32